MRDEFLPFSRPTITEEDVAAVGEVLRSGWITTGPKTAEFEKNFCEYLGCPGAVALSSATAGMHLVLKAIGIGPGDEVVTPSLTWVSTVNLIVLAGATPVFADVDRDTLMVTPEAVEACLTDRTRLIIPVHFAGAPVDREPLCRLADERGIALVEDAAHALGTHYKGEPIGRRGTSIFSFHPIKNITTGEGGMVCSDDEGLLDRIRRLRFHGLGVDAYDRQRPLRVSCYACARGERPASRGGGSSCRTGAQPRCATSTRTGRPGMQCGKEPARPGPSAARDEAFHPAGPAPGRANAGSRRTARKAWRVAVWPAGKRFTPMYGASSAAPSPERSASAYSWRRARDRRNHCIREGG